VLRVGLFDPEPAVVVAVLLDALLPRLLAVSRFLDDLFDVGVAVGAFRLDVGGVAAGRFELGRLVGLALGVCLRGVRLLGRGRRSGLAALDDLGDAVGQLGLDVSLAAVLCGDVDVNRPGSLGGLDP